MKPLILIAILATILPSSLWGQPAARPLTFEVASIKPAAPDARGRMIRIMPGGGLTVTNVTLKLLLTVAYDVRDFQISGGKLIREQIQERLRALLAERFQLTIHREIKLEWTPDPGQVAAIRKEAPWS
jgi:hypothetical protein